MADKRVIVEDLEAAPRIRTREMQTSDFRRPAAPINPVQGQSQLGQLVESLESFNAGLRNFNQIYMQKSNRAAVDEALVDFYQNPDKYREAAKGGVAEMVRKGLIDSNQNPYKATTILELTGQDLADGKYGSVLTESLKQVGDYTPEQLDEHIGKIRQDFIKNSVGDSYYTNLGFSKRASDIERSFKSQARELRLRRQEGQAQEKLTNLSTKVFDDMLAGDFNDDAFATEQISRLRGIFKEAHLGTISEDPNGITLKSLKGWVRANYQDNPEEVRQVVEAVFEIDPRGDGNKLKNISPAEYGELQDYLDNNENEVLQRAYQRQQLLDNIAQTEARKFIRTFAAERRMETGQAALSDRDKRDLVVAIQKQPWYNKENSGVLLDIAVGENGIANEESAVGPLSNSTEEFSQQKGRFERAANDPVLAPQALEDLRNLYDSGSVSPKEFKELESRLEQAAQNKDLTDKSEIFNFNKTSLTEFINTRLQIDPENVDDVSRKAALMDEGLRMYRESVSSKLLAERNAVSGEPAETFNRRIITSPIYGEARTEVQKQIESKLQAEERRLEKQKQVQKDIESNTSVGSPSFFDKIFKGNSTLIDQYKDVSSAMARAISKNPALDRPEYREQLKGYYSEIKKMADEDLAKFGETILEGGYYVTDRTRGGVEPGIAPWLATAPWNRKTRAFGLLPGTPETPAYTKTFVPYPVEKMEEVKKSFLSRVTATGTTWTNFVDSQTGKPRENVRLYGVPVDAKAELNGLAVPLFSSRDEFNDVFSKPELAKNLADSLGVDINQLKVNQALRLLERGL